MGAVEMVTIAGTDWCMVMHQGYCVSGSAVSGQKTAPRPGSGPATAMSSSPDTTPGSSVTNRG